MQLLNFDHVTYVKFKSAAVYKISWKSDDFSLRYGDISIFKMAAVRHFGIVLLPYETVTTHEVSVAGRSCLSNFIFRIFGLKCLFRPPKWGFWETLAPEMWLCIIERPSGTSLRKSASFKLSTVKIRWGVWPVGELTKSVTNTHTETDTHR